MIFTRNLLNNYIDIANLSNEEITTALTSLGFEIASLKPLCQGSNLVAGKILEIKKHPNADRLNVCQVDIGEQVNQIVCGAPNVKIGQNVIVALEGCELPIGLTIKKTKIRDEQSNGMICSLKEIGFPENLIDEENAKGIYAIKKDVTIGDKDILKNLLFEDSVFELEITPNRPDAWSLITIAKELAIYFKKEIKKLEISEFKKSMSDDLSTIKKCDFLMLSKISNISNEINTPYKIAHYLRLLGINTQNFLVDISNFVMLETGQPTHFYDSSQINSLNDIRVSQNKQENFIALNDQRYDVKNEDIVIMKKDEIISLAGIIGDKKHKVTDATTEIIIETGIFDKTTIRKTMRRINLISQASLLFAKGRNKKMAILALQRIIYYLKKYLPETKVDETLVYDNVIESKEIIFGFKKVNSHLGININKEKICEILKSLGCVINGNNIKIPEERLDLKASEDLLEEIARIYGYDNIPSILNPSLPSQNKNDKMYDFICRIKNILSNLGSFETKSYALTSEEQFCDFAMNCDEALKLNTFVSQNKKVMKQSIIPSLIDVCQYNFKNKVKGVNIFEISRLYGLNGENIELGILHFGDLIKQNLFNKSTTACLFTIKGYLEYLFNKLSIPKQIYEIKPMLEENKFYNHYVACQIFINKKLVGYFGEVNKIYLKNWKGSEIYVLQLDLKQLLDIQVPKLQYQAFSRIPIVSQDFTFIVDKEMTYGKIALTFKKLKLPFKYNFELIDIFIEDKNDTKKALTINFNFLDKNKTLNNEGIKMARNQIIKLSNNFNGIIKE